MVRDGDGVPPITARKADDSYQASTPARVGAFRFRSARQTKAKGTDGAFLLRLHRCFSRGRARRGAAPRRQRRGSALAWLRLSVRHADRSEEHTSELQSLMRISYAVFCLIKTIINDVDRPKH